MTWSPPWWRPVLLAVLAVIIPVLAPDDATPVPQAVAVVLLLLAGFEALARPTLVAHRSGLRWRTGLRHHEAAWQEVRDVRATTGRRGVVALDGLELDVAAEGDPEHELVVIPRWRLGADPADVRVAVEQLRESGPFGQARAREDGLGGGQVT